jgi:tripeptidyl-peptidase-1
MTYPTRIFYYSTGGFAPSFPDNHTSAMSNAPFLDWLRFVLEQPKTPQTISSSYSDDEPTVPHEYASIVCHMFARLGARGSSVIVLSGHRSSASGQDGCFGNRSTSAISFVPTFPASCESLIFPFYSVSTWEVGIYSWFMRPLRHDGWRHNRSEP